MFHTIVVGVDRRDGGRDALFLAARLARLTGARLIAVQVVRHEQYPGRDGAPPLWPSPQGDAEAELRAELERCGLEALVGVVADTSPARALHRVAEAENAGLIVVGSTHHGRAGRVFAGDDAAGTIHASPCPVAVAPRGFADREWRGVADIGVGFDGRPEAQQALDLAIGLARDCDATVKVRTVVPAPVNDAQAALYDRRWLDAAKTSAEEELRDVFRHADARISGLVVAGLPVAELVAFSEDVDLLVVGSRGWGPVRRVLAGSTATHLMREAHCPVLVLPRGVATGQPGEREADAGAAASTTA